MKIKLPSSILRAHLESILKLEESDSEAFGMFLADQLADVVKEGDEVLFTDGNKAVVRVVSIATRMGESHMMLAFEEDEYRFHYFNILGEQETEYPGSKFNGNLDLDVLYGNNKESKYYTSN